ncbi:MAG TPA: hypothetical protein GX702_14700 [Chloroflexi bacterium]|jgi:hypothetical protein|nr:hypothetical protein [Chloroflexota bacterium]
MKRNHNVFWGLILVLIGLFLAFDRWLGISLWRLAGPSFIILLGMWLVLQGMGSRSVGAAGRGRSSSREALAAQGRVDRDERLQPVANIADGDGETRRLRET